MVSLTGRLPALTISARKHWAAAVVLLVMFLLYVLVGMSLGGLDGGDAQARKVLPSSDVQPLPKGPPPVPEPLAFRDIAPTDAVAYNASVPLSKEPNPAARGFVIKSVSEADRLRSIDCLTAAVYYEAAVESTDGQRAVAQVVLNRMRHPAFPKTVCGVVFQGSDRATGCQFTFTCDGALARAPSKAGWARARKVAEGALAGQVYKPVGWATHYHTNWVVPYWSSSLTKLANVGTHIFYRWAGGWGRPPAFRHAYAGVEPQIALMRNLSSVPIDPALPIEGSLLVSVQTLPAGVTPDDFKGRAVIRRYEPLRQQAAAASRSELAKADVPPSLRWALTGEGGPDKTIPPGNKGGSASPDTKPKAETRTGSAAK